MNMLKVYIENVPPKMKKHKVSNVMNENCQRIVILSYICKRNEMKKKGMNSFFEFTVF